jgi:hypothetical protein
MKDEVQKLRTFLTNLIAEEQQARNEQTIRRESRLAIVGAVRKIPRRTRQAVQEVCTKAARARFSETM